MTTPLNLQQTFKSVLRTGMRSSMYCLALMLCAATASAQTLKAGDLAPFEVTYEVGNNLISAGTASLKLEPAAEDGHWMYSLNTHPKGIFKLAGKGRIEESSAFKTVELEGTVELRPYQYSYRQDDERRRAVDASFDWAKKTLTHVYRGNKATEPLNTPVLDRLTATLLIMNGLRHDFKRVQLPIFSTDEVKLVVFTNDGVDTLNTPLGEVDTIRVTSRNASGGHRETITWFAPSLDYLPIKIEHRKRGDLVARFSLIRLQSATADIQLSGALPVAEDFEDTAGLLEEPKPTNAQ